MSNARRTRRKIERKSAFKEAEEVLLHGTPSDMYALIPERQRKAFESFARCFGINKEDIQRLTAR